MGVLRTPAMHFRNLPLVAIVIGTAFVFWWYRRSGIAIRGQPETAPKTPPQGFLNNWSPVFCPAKTGLFRPQGKQPHDPTLRTPRSEKNGPRTSSPAISQRTSIPSTHPPIHPSTHPHTGHRLSPGLLVSVPLPGRLQPHQPQVGVAPRNAFRGVTCVGAGGWGARATCPAGVKFCFFHMKVVLTPGLHRTFSRLTGFRSWASCDFSQVVIFNVPNPTLSKTQPDSL